MVACKSCSRELAAEEGRQVATWTLCEPCFEAVLNPSRGEAPAPAPTPLPEPPRPGCSLCDGPIAVGEGMDLGPVRLCGDCAALARSLEDPTEALEDPDDVRGEGSEPQVVHEPVTWALTACAGCGRSIPERGSKAREGAHYCPDCFHALPALAVQQASPILSPGVPSGEGECDACGRGLTSGAAELLRGFRICLACRVTDEGLALELARERHQRRLAAIKAQFGS